MIGLFSCAHNTNAFYSPMYSNSVWFLHEQHPLTPMSFSLFAAESESTAEPGAIQDILTCGSCQKTFALGDIVKFIQHKVLQCNKENYGQCFPQGENFFLWFQFYLWAKKKRNEKRSEFVSMKRAVLTMDFNQFYSKTRWCNRWQRLRRRQTVESSESTAVDFSTNFHTKTIQFIVTRTHTTAS